MGFGNLAGWYSYFLGTIIRHTRVSGLSEIEREKVPFQKVRGVISAFTEVEKEEVPSKKSRVRTCLLKS